MAFALTLLKTTKARNSTKQESGGTTTNVLLKDDTSLIKPTFRLHLNYNGMASFTQVSQFNYCYCAEFKRYYYITNIVSVTAAIVDIYCEVDVLATFRSDILATDAWVMYAESKYNTMLPDSRVPISDSSEVFIYKYPMELCDEEGCFVLTVASKDASGDSGPATSYCLNSAQMAEVAEHLYADDVWMEIKNELYHPDEAIIGCIWVPFKYNEVGGATTYPISFGKYDLGSGQTVERTIVGNCMVTPHVNYYGVDEQGNPNAWADYRNCEPYSVYSLYLPGVGTVTVPMYNLIGLGAEQPKFQIGITASPMTGDIVYNIERICGKNGSPIAVGNKQMVVRGNLGVQVPIAAARGAFLNALSSGLVAGGGAVMTALAPNPMTAMMTANNLVEYAKDLYQQTYSTSGSIGGWTLTPDEVTQIEVATTVHYISDEPSRIRKTIGRPLYRTERLGSLSGLVKCTGAYVRTWATEEEHNMIAQYVNSSTNFIFGGLIIE